ncbi:MAG: SufS family cysteine desulfurase [archaeon]
MSFSKLRDDFPILSRKVNGHALAYLDNAATAQKPRAVVERMSRFWNETNSNVHRGMHALSARATDEYEGAREKIARFIGAKSPREIIFTKNATEGLNLLARTLPKISGKGRVVLTEMEHHSNLVPWQENCGRRLGFVPFDRKTGKLCWREFDFSGTAIASITHESNYLGTINPVRKISRALPERAFLAVDGAQSVPNFQVDVGRLGADFLVFSGHKMCGPTGIGVLWGREELLERLPPFLYGGEMISTVSLRSAEWNSLPWKFEAGTPPIAEAIGLGAAVNYLRKIGLGRIRKHGARLTGAAIRRISEIGGARIFGPGKISERGGLVSFELPGIHPHDIAGILDKNGIAIRAGHHCAEPISKKLGVPGAARASFYFYNTLEEVERLGSALERVLKVFKGRRNW